jgi:hypothetical protein
MDVKTQSGLARIWGDASGEAPVSKMESSGSLSGTPEQGISNFEVGKIRILRHSADLDLIPNPKFFYEH